MITLILKNNKACPFIFCDRCGELIEDIHNGMVIFEGSIYSHEGAQSKPTFIHKRKCDGKLAETQLWMELRTFLADLAYNHDITPDKLRNYLKDDNHM